MSTAFARRMLVMPRMMQASDKVGEHYPLCVYLLTQGGRFDAIDRILWDNGMDAMHHGYVL